MNETGTPQAPNSFQELDVNEGDSVDGFIQHKTIKEVAIEPIKKREISGGEDSIACAFFVKKKASKQAGSDSCSRGKQYY